MSRFGDVGPSSPERPSERAEFDPVGCSRAALGFVIGGFTAVVMVVTDPFGVTAFTLPQGLDPAEQLAAFDRWRSSPGVILGQLTMAWIPLLVSGLCGGFAHASLPASIPAALLRTVGVASLLSMVLWAGEPVVERALGTGQSSDIQGGVAGLAFTALCIALSAPLSSALTRRRRRANRSGPPMKSS